MASTPKHTASRGIALAGLGRLEEAEASFRQVVALRGDDAEAHNLLGAVLAAQEKWPKPSRIIKRRFDFGPASPRFTATWRRP